MKLIIISIVALLGLNSQASECSRTHTECSCHEVCDYSARFNIMKTGVPDVKTQKCFSSELSFYKSRVSARPFTYCNLHDQRDCITLYK